MKKSSIVLGIIAVGLLTRILVPQTVYASEWNLARELKNCLIYAPGTRGEAPVHYYVKEESVYQSLYYLWGLVELAGDIDWTVGGKYKEGQLAIHPPSSNIPTVIEFKVKEPSLISFYYAMTDHAAKTIKDKSADGIRLIVLASDKNGKKTTLINKRVTENRWQKDVFDLSSHQQGINIIVSCDPCGTNITDHFCLVIEGKGRISPREDVINFSSSILPGLEKENITSKRLKVYCNSPWLLPGIIEELRSFGLKIPPRLQELEDEIYIKLNLPDFFRSGTFNSRLREAIQIIESFSPPKGAPSVYQLFGQVQLYKLKVKKPELPPFETDTFLKDRILAAEGKAYPYLLDFNLDGLIDLISGDHDGFINIYLNQGSNQVPEYSTPIRLKSTFTGENICFAPNSKLSIADMNGDKKPDIILGSYGGRVRMLPNISKKKGYLFDDKKVTYFYINNQEILDVGNYAYPIVVDWNLDGLPDLLVGEEKGNLFLFRNNGTPEKPSFRKGEVIISITPDMYPDPVFNDLNGDSLPDIILGGREGLVYFFPNIGSKGFPRFSNFSYLRCGRKRIDVGRLSQIYVGDWNADENLDLLVGNDDGEIRVFLGKKNTGGKPSFSSWLLLRTKEDVSMVPKVHPVFCPVDWNGDGKNDILMGGEGDEVRFYPNIGNSAEPCFNDYQLIPGVKIERKTFSRRGTGERYYWNNKGLEFVTEYLGNISPDAVDWNGDGKIDLLVGNYAGLIYFYKNVGSSTSPKLASPVPLKAGGKLLRVAGFSTPRAVDYNNDGLLDLLTGDLLGRIHIYLNIGSLQHPKLDRGYRLKVSGEEFALGPRSIVEYGDLNQDGLKDLIIGNRWGKVYALLNQGTKRIPKFTKIEGLREKNNKKIKNLNLGSTSCPRLVDWNKDGKEELLISNNSHNIFIFHPCSQ